MSVAPGVRKARSTAWAWLLLAPLLGCRREPKNEIRADRVRDADVKAPDDQEAEISHDGVHTKLPFGRARFDGLGWLEVVLSDAPVGCLDVDAKNGVTWVTFTFPSGPGGHFFDHRRVGMLLRARVGGRADPDVVFSGDEGGVHIDSVERESRRLVKGTLDWDLPKSRARGRFSATLCNDRTPADVAWDTVPAAAPASNVRGTIRGETFVAQGVIARVLGLGGGSRVRVMQVELLPVPIARCTDDATLPVTIPRLVVATYGDSAIDALPIDGPRPARATFLNAPALKPGTPTAGFLAEGLGPAQRTWIAWEQTNTRIGERLHGSLVARGDTSVSAHFEGLFEALVCGPR